MTTTPDGDDLAVLALEPADLDGHSIDELTDYLDAGMTPADPSIDDSAACQNAIAAISRVRRFAGDLLEADALDEPERDDSWVSGILQNISLEAAAGRDIPVRTATATEDIVLTEGSVRALIRRAGDGVDGILIGRCALDGDVTDPDAEVSVTVSATILYGHRIPDVTDRVRSAIHRELLRHTRLRLTGVDITIRDLYLEQSPAKEILP